MKILILLLFALIAAPAAAQTPEVWATAKGRTFTAADLSPEGQKLFADQAALTSRMRSTLWAEMFSEALLEAEAKAQKTTPEKLVETQVATVPDPTDAEIIGVYEAAKSQLGGKTLAEARPDIVAYIRRDKEDKVMSAYYTSLRAKHKAVVGKDVNDAALRPADVIFTVAGTPVTAAEFEKENLRALADFQGNLFDGLRSDLEFSILRTLVVAEAEALKTTPTAVLESVYPKTAGEPTEDQLAAAQTLLKKQLFTKYDVKFVRTEPAPIVETITFDDDPVVGSAAAPVTVVMFSDYQCSACAATHPVVKRVIAEFAGKVRFAVRDYPLTNIHPDAMNAALAANAAHKQGKYTEFADKLYANQAALDSSALRKYAAEFGLNVKQFEADMAAKTAADEIARDREDGRNLGITGTPTIYVNGVKVRSFSEEAFREAIERALKK